MTYNEKRLDRKLRRIATACNVSAIIGLTIALSGVVAAMLELWLNQPYSLCSILPSVCGGLICLNSTVIGSLIEK